MIYSLTGPAEQWGNYGRQAAELAAQEVNSTGGINGRPLKLIFEDSKTSSAGAVAAYRKLVDIERADALVGDVWDFVTNPLVPLTKTSKKILLSPTVVPAAIESESEYFFTLGHQLPLVREATDKFFALNPDIKTVAILCWDNAWGRAYVAQWKQILEGRGIKVVYERALYDFDYDYKSDAAAMAAKRPDAVLMEFQTERIIKRMHELKFYPKILSTSDLLLAKFNKLLPDSELEGGYFIDWDAPEDFRKSFQAKFGHAPMFEAFSHYQAVKSLAQAFELKHGDLLSSLKSVRLEQAGEIVDFSRGFAANFGKGELKKFSGGAAVNAQ